MKKQQQQHKQQQRQPVVRILQPGLTGLFLLLCFLSFLASPGVFVNVVEAAGYNSHRRWIMPLHRATSVRPWAATTTTTTKSRDDHDDATWNAIASLRGGVSVEVSDIVVSAYDWCINLGAPSALVAGAVIATIYENIGSGALDVRRKDTYLVRCTKRLTRVLLITAFALEVLAIFVTTVTGTMLLSRTLDYMDEVVPVTLETTPLAFLRSNFEFEYLTARIAFLQGVLNWMTAIALAHYIPNATTGVTRKMNQFIGTLLCSTILLMLAFYNNHMTFYDNYFTMVIAWIRVTLKRFVFHNPPRPLVFLMGPCLLACVIFGIQTFFYSLPDDEMDELIIAAAAAGNGDGSDQEWERLE